MARDDSSETKMGKFLSVIPAYFLYINCLDPDSEYRSGPIQFGSGSPNRWVSLVKWYW